MSFKDHESKVDSQFLDRKIHVLGVLIRTEGPQGLNPYLFAADQPPPISAPIAAGYLKSRGSYRAHACILLHIGHPEVASHIAFEGP